MNLAVTADVVVVVAVVVVVTSGRFNRKLGDEERGKDPVPDGDDAPGFHYGHGSSFIDVNACILYAVHPDCAESATVDLLSLDHSPQRFHCWRDRLSNVRAEDQATGFES